MFNGIVETIGKIARFEKKQDCIYLSVLPAIPFLDLKIGDSVSVNGVCLTVVACKTLIKQRFCKSGMRWKIGGIKSVLRLRELTQTDGRWQQLWGKINQYGIPCLH